MLGEKGTIVVKAITGADALTGSDFSDFEASAYLMEDATGGATGTVNAKKFKVINTLSVPVHVDDELVVTKTIQGFYVTVSHSPCRAKWIKFAYSFEGTVTVDAFYDGSDPTECGTITVIYPLGEPCDGDNVIAFYNPNEDEYVAIATESAMMGTPTPRNMPTTVDPSSCGIAVTKEQFRMFPSLCEPATPNQEFLSLGETVPVVVSVSAGECGEIAYAYQNIKAFACDSEGEPTSPSFGSFPIGLGDIKLLTGASFGSNPNCGSATWTYNTDTGAWTLVSGCPGGCSGETPTVPPSTFKAQYEWDGSEWNILFPCEEGGSSSPPADPGGVVGEVAEVGCIHTVLVPCEASEGASCGLNLEFQTLDEICNPTESPSPPHEPEVVHVPLQLSAINVVQEVYQGSSGIVVERAIVYVCSWEEAAEDLIATTPCPTSPGGTP